MSQESAPITSPSVRLHPPPAISFRLTVHGLPHVVVALLGADGEPVSIPASVKPQAGTRIAGALLVCDEDGSLVLPKLRTAATTLHLLPASGTAKAKSQEHAKARTGDTLHLTAQELRAGVKIPLDLASARASGEFALAIEIDLAHVHRCC
jgi:hypothetical protein